METTTTKTTMIVSLLYALVLLVSLPQPSEAQGLRRLRKKTTLRVPDLNPLTAITNNKKKQHQPSSTTTKATTTTTDTERDAGFELTEEQLEDVYINEVFRMDHYAVMSLSFPPPTHHASTGKDDGSDIYKKCSIPRSDRNEQLLDILSEISPRGQLTTMDTARYEARYWLTHEDDAKICPDNKPRVLQRYRAALIYFQFGGDNWNNCRAQGGTCFQEDSTTVPAIRFLDKSNECLWFGLTCEGLPTEALPSQSDIISADAYSPLISVDISDNSLSGRLFPELFGLTQLQELTLDGNKGISGTIPNEIGQLTNMVALDIDDNALVGTLPSSLYTLTKLEAIDLNSNRLSGTISNAIGDLRNLVVVQFDKNIFSGTMPTDGIFNLEMLAVWTALDNDITGSTERVCNVLDQRRVANDFPGYLQFFWVDCLGNPPQVECSCCECQEPQSPTQF